MFNRIITFVSVLQNKYSYQDSQKCLIFKVHPLVSFYNLEILYF